MQGNALPSRNQQTDMVASVRQNCGNLPSVPTQPSKNRARKKKKKLFKKIVSVEAATENGIFHFRYFPAGTYMHS